MVLALVMVVRVGLGLGLGLGLGVKVVPLMILGLMWRLERDAFAGKDERLVAEVTTAVLTFWRGELPLSLLMRRVVGWWCWLVVVGGWWLVTRARVTGLACVSFFGRKYCFMGIPIWEFAGCNLKLPETNHG